MKKEIPTPAGDRLEVIERIKEYEKLGGEAFFRDVENDPPSRTLLPDEVDYLNKKLSSKIKCAAASFIEWACKHILGKKFRITVVGGENIRDIEGGAIITSNHFAPTENLAVKVASECARKKRRLYKVVREGNFFMSGMIGFLLKHARTLPLSSDIHTMKNLDSAITTILSKGDFILVYPEQAMWWNYTKPREYRIGAYHYAAKNGVPIVPCFVTLKGLDTVGKNGFYDVTYTIHVMPPLYPDPELSVRENARAMLEKNRQLCRAKYEEIYKRPLEYGNYESEFLPK
ncbi:MAG: 1-acyl-sn-glycerol-3-phosphate acyltransferase [Clostridia bacterium]|nr:1-acyl-sn-glycerol-3-phosphate acyltransferase [Clostridia bacterium]